MRDNGERLVWLLVGAAIGACVALLYAPQSGEKTRKMIGKKMAEGREAVGDTGREWLDKGRELYEKGRKVADDAAEFFERGRRIVQG
jgi:gas vesicle protein